MICLCAEFRDFICRDNSVDECELDIYFVTNLEVLGKLSQHELKPGGTEIKLAEANKSEYLK